MTKSPFAKSNTKTALVERLGLYGAEGEQIYALLHIQNEASIGRDRLSHDYNSLTNYSRQKGVRAPYKWDDLQETARHKETMNIARTASAYTRPYYQMGQWMSAVEENWVAEWFLWHSFRYRDNRNYETCAEHLVGGHTTEGGGSGHGGKLPLGEPVVYQVQLTLV
ncbi:hypothetical protein PSPO01_15487 [Paraphaeosphaeria sporulosa]